MESFYGRPRRLFPYLVVAFVQLPLHTHGASDGSAADVTGVSGNKEDDLVAFMGALTTNFCIVIAIFVLFSVLRFYFPWVYSKPSLGQEPPPSEFDALLDWLKLSSNVKLEDTADIAGLDAALVIEFCSMCTKMLAVIGIPMFAIVSPLHYHYGGGEAIDLLGKVSMGNIREGHPWLYHVHAGLVWLVLLIVHGFIHTAQAKFLNLRFHWLHRLSVPRCNTVLVEGIPVAWRSDIKLKEFFEGIFRSEHVDHVVNASIVKRLGNLPLLFQKRDAAAKAKDHAERLVALGRGRSTVRPACCANKEDSIDYYGGQVDRLDEKIYVVRAGLESQAKTDLGHINSHSGFVTFRRRREAELALNLRYNADDSLWRISAAPDASDIRWQDLIREGPVLTVFAVVGYTLLCTLFLVFIPIVTSVTTLTTWVDVPHPLKPLWSAFAPTLGLLIFMSLLPTVMLLIFRSCFVLRADTWAQQKLQLWFFIFQVVFLLFVTAVSRSVLAQLEQVKELFEKPSMIVEMLASTLPNVTHFFLNYLVMQWTHHAVAALRLANLIKFIMYRAVYEDFLAKQYSEPEDQDSSGIGARSVLLTINCILGISFCCLEPLMPVIAMVAFALCRILYGYLIPRAETKKSDLGGAFWVTSLKQVYFGMLYYSCLMTGVLTLKAKGTHANMIAMPSILFVAWSYVRFVRRFEWERLPWEELAFPSEGTTSSLDDEVEQQSVRDYIQPELRHNESRPSAREARQSVREARQSVRMHDRAPDSDERRASRKSRRSRKSRMDGGDYSV